MYIEIVYVVYEPKLASLTIDEWKDCLYTWSINRVPSGAISRTVYQQRCPVVISFWRIRKRLCPVSVRLSDGDRVSSRRNSIRHRAANIQCSTSSLSAVTPPSVSKDVFLCTPTPSLQTSVYGRHDRHYIQFTAMASRVITWHWHGHPRPCISCPSNRSAASLCWI